MSNLETLPTPAARKVRDPFHVFAFMPKKDDNIPANTRALWDRLSTGPIGPFKFTTMSAQCFSTAKARNIGTALALETDCGKFFQVDADMNLADIQVQTILERPEKVVGGLYPKKVVSLQQLWVCNFVPGTQVRPDLLWEVVDIGGGALKIDMDVIEGLIAPDAVAPVDDEGVAHPVRAYRCEEAEWRGMTMWDLWSEGVVVEDWNRNGKPWPRYLTEDFFGCWRIRKAGHQIWGDCKAQCGHFGTVDFFEVMTVIEELKKAIEGGGVSAEEAHKAAIRGLLPPGVR